MTHSIPRGGQKCTGNHTWQFDQANPGKDPDGWIHGSAHCINCEETTYLWLWPQLGTYPELPQTVEPSATVQNLYGVGYHKKAKK